MSSGTSSAYPAHLLAYAQGGLDGDTALTRSGTTLSLAIIRLWLTFPDPAVLAPFQDWGAELVGYAAQKREVDQWVGDVGRAFRNADRHAKGRVTVATDRLPALVARADPAVAAALQTFQDNLHADSALDGDRGDLTKIDASLAGLSPEQMDEFLDALSDQQLRAWNAKIAGDHDVLWYHWGLDGTQRTDLANLLFLNAGASQVARLEKDMPSLQPSPQDEELTGGLTWKSVAGLPLFDPGTRSAQYPDGKPEPFTDINQGDNGDCWFLSGLGAVAQTDPSAITRNIHQNPNGTYTVTFYRDGEPVPITVTDTVPYSSTLTFDYSYAHDNNGDGKWVMIYEKAFAQFDGGYGKIEGGWGDVSMSAVTGKTAVRSDTQAQSLTDISNKLHSGYALTAGSDSGSNDDRTDDNQIVLGHEYMVESVNLKAGTITLMNPWGAQGAAPHVVTLSASDFRRYFNEVSYVQLNGAS